jgi:hypothetical protein
MAMSHGNEQEDRALGRAAAQALRQSETVDSHTAARLAAARQRALAVAGKPAMARRWLVPASAFAAIALAVLALRPQQQAVQAPVIANAHDIDTLDLLTDDMSPAFYRDLEFYQWLEKERPHA